MVHPKTDDQRERLANVVSKMLIFSSLDEVTTYSSCSTDAQSCKSGLAFLVGFRQMRCIAGKIRA